MNFGCIPPEHPTPEFLDDAWEYQNHAILSLKGQMPQRCVEGHCTDETHPSNNPNVRLPAVDPYVGMPEKFLLQSRIHCTNSLWPGENVDVVNICKNPLIGFQSRLNGHKCWVLSHNEDQGHQTDHPAHFLRLVTSAHP